MKDEVKLVRYLREFVPDIAFLELQDQNKKIEDVDVNNICFIKDNYFIIIWNFATKNAKLMVSEIPLNHQVNLQALTKDLQKIEFPDNEEMREFCKYNAAVKGKNIYINYFTVMLCFVMPYTKYLFDVDIINYNIDTSTLNGDERLKVVLDAIASAYNKMI